ncbi:Mam33 protein [Starmerella bacillaris]|uniref:Mam33 protein n=1 Tax=Starmerella bacillaris TaxID=1247836 RepID=A0AAV5RKX4_STABA|nr:Mam33 protein [Starmerella bacillaris]
MFGRSNIFKLSQRLCAKQAAPLTPTAFLRAQSQRSFSTSRLYYANSDFKETTDGLIAALQAERAIELNNIAETQEENAKILQWPQDHGFEVIRQRYHDQVQLVKKISESETLRVFFAVSDIINAESMLEEPEPEFSESEEMEEDIDTPVRLNVIIEKPTGSVGFDCTVQDDVVSVDGVVPYKDSALAIDESAEAAQKRSDLYQGPPFAVLDPSLQSAVQSYLEARGINGDFALFVQEFAGYLENSEYSEWLDNIANIVE